MKKDLLLVLAAVLMMWNVVAQQKLPLLVVQGEHYTNVTVTAVTKTHLEFQHSRGVASVKLKNLEPELQKRFKFDPDAAAAAESSQSESDARYRAAVAAQKPVKSSAPAAESASPKKPEAEVDLVVPIHAKSFRGEKGPALQVEEWVSSAPETQGKFVLVDFWATWCGPCRASIPHLNELQAKFKDRMVVIGVSNETAERVKAMKSPVMEYSVGVDTKARMQREAEVRGIPHAMLYDPEGVIRFEGMPNYLSEQNLERLLDKYSK